MRQRIAVRSLALLLLALFVAPLAAQDDPKPTKEPKVKKATLVVVRVDDRFEVLEKTKVAEFKKASATRYKNELAGWNDRKKRAKKDKQRFTEPKPKKEKVKVFAKTFDDREKADAFIKLEQAKAAKKKKPSRNRN